MRFSKMLAAFRVIRISTVVAAMLAAGSGCAATDVTPADEQEITTNKQDGEKGAPVIHDAHTKAMSMLDVSGGASEESGGYPYCDQGEAFVGTDRAVSGGQQGACNAARDEAVSQCEATECYDRDQRKVRAFDCDPEPNACVWSSTWYGWYAEFTVHGD